MQKPNEPVRYEEAIPPAVDAQGLFTYLEAQPDVVAAYVFGSHAEGRAHSESDVDIAVLLQENDDVDLFDRRLRLMSEVEDFATSEVDLVVLNTAPPLLQHQILKHGRLIFERDRTARVEFTVRAMQRYADLQPMFEYFTSAVLEEIKEGSLGERRRNCRRTSRSAPQ